MHAIIETGGKQYKVTEGDTLFIEKLASEAGENVTFDKVLAVIDGDKITVGTPVVEGAKVDASVVKNGKGKKVIVFKYKPKKGYRRKQGHRQPYTKVTIGKMTTVTFHMEGERIVGFTVQGHSGYADEGSDIICAAVTSAVRLTECAVNDVLGLGASVKVRESDASITMKIPGGLSEANETTCQTLLAALMVHFASLHEEYPDHISVMEEE